MYCLIASDKARPFVFRKGRKRTFLRKVLASRIADLIGVHILKLTNPWLIWNRPCLSLWPWRGRAVYAFLETARVSGDEIMMDT